MAVAEKFIQKNRFMAVNTPLGDDRLLLKSFTGQEALSELFRFRLECFSEDRDINLDDLVGQNVTWALRTADDKDIRYFNGFVSRFSFVPEESRFARYDVEVVPWLWFLTRTSDCRIFQEKTTQEIVEQVFTDFGFTDYEFNLQGQYFKREYCVQYRETAANFVMRLLEDEGIAFYWKHENGRHVMVLFDSPAAYLPCPRTPEVEFEQAGGTAMERTMERVHSWRIEKEFRPGKYALNDFNFETPLDPLLVLTETVKPVGGNKSYEIYDYPGEYKDTGEGDVQVRIRMEEEETPFTVVTGAADVRDFSPGYRFHLLRHPRQDLNRGYTILRIRHDAHEGGTYTGTEGSGAMYSSTFSAFPDDVPYRPPRLTPKPIIQGSQTALVVGPPGEEIWTDKYGRVKLHFWWDRYGKKDGSDTCWIRVSQYWAGKQWGSMYIPRIGQEVQVDFLEGDPDRPLVTGRLYNADQLVPYPLPDEQTKSTVKSCSVGGEGFNEIRFEDKAGKEQIFVHAQLDYDFRVLQDYRDIIKRDRHEIVKGFRREKIGGYLHVQVGQDSVEKVGQSKYIEAGKDIFLKAGGKIVLDAPEISINGGGAFLKLQGAAWLVGKLVLINSGGSASKGTAITPQDPIEADDAEPGQCSVSKHEGPLDDDPGAKTTQSKSMGDYHYVLADINYDTPAVQEAAKRLAPMAADNLLNALRNASPAELGEILSALPSALTDPNALSRLASSLLGAPGLSAAISGFAEEVARVAMGPLRQLLAGDGELMDKLRELASSAEAEIAAKAKEVLEKITAPLPPIAQSLASKMLGAATRALPKPPSMPI